MEKDAMPAGNTNIGTLVSTAEIRILICYLLAAIGEPVPGQMLANVLHYEGLANAFEVTDAIEYLIKGGQLQVADEQAGTYLVTPNGKNIADTLKTSLSMTIRERAYVAALKMQPQFKNAKDNDFAVTKEEDRLFLTCTAKDGGKPFMSVKLLVGDHDQANLIKEKFLSRTDLYAKIMELITK